jgi:hypothetical protein
MTLIINAGATVKNVDTNKVSTINTPVEVEFVTRDGNNMIVKTVYGTFLSTNKKNISNI